MTIDCLTCAEIEQKICDLQTDLVSVTDCGGLKVNEDGTTFDYTGILEAKKYALGAWVEIYKMKCDGSNDLYEFVHVPCVKPATCVGTSACSAPSRMRMNRRRYSGGRRR